MFHSAVEEQRLKFAARSQVEKNYLKRKSSPLNYYTVGLQVLIQRLSYL